MKVFGYEHRLPGMVAAATILSEWQQAATIPKGHFRNKLYWAAVAALLEQCPSVLVIASIRGWHPELVARQMLDRRARW